MIYLDHASTTPIDKEVAQVMIEWLTKQYGNPSSKYYTLAEDAKLALKNARGSIASLINSKEDEIIFTSGASESNNFIIKGVADQLKNKGNHIITSEGEHKSVLETCKYLENKGFEVTYLPIDNKGYVKIEEIEKNIKDNTILVSIIWGNNELGTINDIKTIANICRKNNILFHTDATQVLGKFDIDVEDIKVDLLSFSGHKIYGPKGIGGCYVASDDLGLRLDIIPLIHGGEQEYGLRAGTHSMHNIVGFGKAAEIAKRDMKEYVSKIKKLEDKLLERISSEIPQAQINCNDENKIPGLLSITIPKLNNELFIKLISKKYAISSGSACALGKPSHVLQAIGKGNYTSNTIRVSIGKYNDDCILGLVDEIKEYLDKYTF